MANFNPRKSAQELRSLYRDPNVKELSKKDSYDKVRGLIKQQEQLSRAKMVPGNIVFTSYNAKDKESTYDRTPLILVLRSSKTYTLGLNFHWLPLGHRLYLIEHINKNTSKGSSIQFSYDDLKPMLKSLGYAPCIRLYINNRLAKRGVVIPPDRLREVAMLKAETFTNGKYSASQLYQMAKNRGRKSNSKKKPKR